VQHPIGCFKWMSFSRCVPLASQPQSLLDSIATQCSSHHLQSSHQYARLWSVNINLPVCWHVIACKHRSLVYSKLMHTATITITHCVQIKFARNPRRPASPAAAADHHTCTCCAASCTCQPPQQSEAEAFDCTVSESSPVSDGTTCTAACTNPEVTPGYTATCDKGTWSISGSCSPTGEAQAAENLSCSPSTCRIAADCDAECQSLWCSGTQQQRDNAGCCPAEGAGLGGRVGIAERGCPVQQQHTDRGERHRAGRRSLLLLYKLQGCHRLRPAGAFAPFRLWG
jgi:hypothetical protein